MAGMVVGSPWRSQVGLLGGAAFLMCALMETGGVPWLPPSPRRQTPKWYKDVFGTTWGSVAWGLDLGQGWTTRIEFAGYYGIATWCLLLGAPATSALVLAAYGFGRGLPVLTEGLSSRSDTRKSPGSWYLSHSGRIHWLNAIVLALVAGYVLMT
jgi:cytochrome c biogenesis protein CcdA